MQPTTVNLDTVTSICSKAVVNGQPPLLNSCRITVDNDLHLQKEEYTASLRCTTIVHGSSCNNHDLQHHHVHTLATKITIPTTSNKISTTIPPRTKAQLTMNNDNKNDVVANNNNNNDIINTGRPFTPWQKFSGVCRYEIFGLLCCRWWHGRWCYFCCGSSNSRLLLFCRCCCFVVVVVVAVVVVVTLVVLL